MDLVEGVRRKVFKIVKSEVREAEMRIGCVQAEDGKEEVEGWKGMKKVVEKIWKWYWREEGGEERRLE